MANFFLGVIVVCIAAGIGLPFLKVSIHAQRRIYWACAAIATLAGFLTLYPNVRNGLLIAASVFAVMVFIAFRSTPYLKIRGKIYAFTLDLRRPDPVDAHNGPDGTASDVASIADPAQPADDPVPDSYNGRLTPATVWWMLVGLTVIAAGNTYAFMFGHGEAGAAALGAAFLAFLAIGFGHGDASWGYRIARGQIIPFAVVSVMTAGTFAVVYLIAYYLGRRWPLRRRQSMEYRAHPRHRQDP